MRAPFLTDATSQEHLTSSMAKVLMRTILQCDQLRPLQYLPCYTVELCKKGIPLQNFFPTATTFGRNFHHGCFKEHCNLNLFMSKFNCHLSTIYLLSSLPISFLSLTSFRNPLPREALRHYTGSSLVKIHIYVVGSSSDIIRIPQHILEIYTWPSGLKSVKVCLIS